MCSTKTHNQGLTNRGIAYTPKAQDLENHYGSLPQDNLYGPNTYKKSDIAREFSSVNHLKVVTPITNLNSINQKDVVNGSLDNTAYDASKIITPILSNPKAIINTTLIHDVVTNTPVHIATQTNTNKLTTLNKITGEISSKTITTEKPIVSIVKNLRKVGDIRKTVYDLKGNKIIFPDTNKKFVGK